MIIYIRDVKMVGNVREKRYIIGTLTLVLLYIYVSYEVAKLFN